jgi:hypothetical protein
MKNQQHFLGRLIGILFLYSNISAVLPEPPVTAIPVPAPQANGLQTSQAVAVIVGPFIASEIGLH